MSNLVILGVRLAGIGIEAKMLEDEIQLYPFTEQKSSFKGICF